MRFAGKVGYATPSEPVKGVWSDDITERNYYGDVLNATSSLEASDKVNPDVRLQNRISIVADAFAFGNFSRIKYVVWDGAFWTVNSVEIRERRLILSLGGVYVGPRPTS